MTRTPASPDQPEIRAMTQHACVALLARQRVGRIAFSYNDRVDIQPIHYVYEAGWLYGRTSFGTKLVTLAHNRWIAFEVDDVRGTFDWESVVVHGSFHRLDPDGPPAEAAHFARAAELLREIVPETLTTDDPVPYRLVFFRIAVGEMTGRVARPRTGAE